MDFDVLSGKLVATCQRNDGSDIGVLVEINPLTGNGTEIGPLGCDRSTDISFRHSDNVLFGALFGGCPFGLNTINVNTGSANFLGSFSLSGCCGNGMAFSIADVLFTANDIALDILDQSDGSVISSIILSYPPPADDFPRINAMDVNPTTGVMFASVVEGNGQQGTNVNFLATVDLDSGVVTIIDETADGLDAIAFAEEVDFTRPIPTLSEIGLIASALVLFAAAIFTLRRRKAHQS